MSDRVYAQLFTIYRPLEIQSAEFDSKREWVDFYRKHKEECYPLSLKLYDPLFDNTPVPITYQFIGMKHVVLGRLVNLFISVVDIPTKTQLRTVYERLKALPVTHIPTQLTQEARIILTRLDYTIYEREGITYVLDSERIPQCFT